MKIKMILIEGGEKMLCNVLRVSNKIMCTIHVYSVLPHEDLYLLSRLRSN